MSILGPMVWEVRATGADTNSGGFATGATGTDYSQQDSPQYSATDLVVDASLNTKVTSASHSFVSTDVGNTMNISAGAGWTTGVYYISSVASGAATLDRTPAATSTTGGTYAVGGAFATIAQAILQIGSGHITYIKAATYNISTGLAFTNGSDPSYGGLARLVGYNTSRDDRGKATIKATADNITMMQLGTAVFLENLIFDGDNRTGIQGVINNSSTGVFNGIVDSVVKNCKLEGIRAYAADLQIARTEITNCGTDNVAWAVYVPQLYISVTDCWIHDNAYGIFTGGTGNAITGCRITNNGHEGISALYRTAIKNCTIHGNASDGIQLNGTFLSIQEAIQNNIITNNGGYGINLPSSLNGAGASTIAAIIGYNAFYGNTAPTHNFAVGIGDIILTGLPYTDAASNDFTLNNTAGQGADCRGTGSSPYIDRGALQHQDSGGGAVTFSMVL
jgi:hypothetical protein